jgi:CoA:oxalate CoA-transferase
VEPNGVTPQSAAAEERPLAGLLVLDFSQFLAGPSCALRLADLGAEVIKVERPQGGDLCRDLYIADQGFEGDSALFHTINRNKKSFAADLKDARDLKRVMGLVARADVMIHNFRPGVMERIGLGYAAVAELNAEIVYATVTGYGATGPWRDKPGQDLLVQSLSGLAWLSGDEGQGPVPAGLSIADMAAGAHLAQGILAKLVGRSLTGRGGCVEVSLLESALDLQFEHFTTWLKTGGPQPKRSAVRNANVYLGAPYGIYATADGHIAVAMTPIERLRALLDCEALAAFDDRATWFARRDEIKQVLAAHLKTRATAHWLSLLEPAGVWCADVLDWPALVEHEAFRALDAVQEIRSPSGAALRTTRCPIRLDGRVLTSPKAAPALGADTADIVQAFDLDAETAQ